MSLLSAIADDFIVLTDGNPTETAYGRKLYLNRNHIVAFYRREDDATATNVITSDGRAYIVQEDEKTIADELV